MIDVTHCRSTLPIVATPCRCQPSYVFFFQQQHIINSGSNRYSQNTWLNAQRSFRSECIDGATGSNRSKTNPMRSSPNDREKRMRPLSEIDSSVQIYHPVFSINNIESSVSLELALQTVFDHAKSQLPDAIAKRVIQRWQFRGHGEPVSTIQHPITAGFIYTVFHTAT